MEKDGIRYNFECPKCGRKYYFSFYTMTFKNGQAIYLDKSTKKELQCIGEDCKKEHLQFIPEEGPINCHFASFSSLSPEEKKNLLRKRSKADAKKKKYKDNEKERVFYNG